MNYEREYHTYLRLERAYSVNTIASYELDLQKLFSYFEAHQIDPVHAQLADLQAFLYDTFRSNSNPRTQARLIASVRSYYRFLLYHHYIDADPSELLEGPKREAHLPVVLSVEEIDRLIAAIDLASNEGHRNRAIVEMLYGSGLRVSELVNLKLSNIYRKEGYMLI